MQTFWKQNKVIGILDTVFKKMVKTQKVSTL